MSSSVSGASSSAPSARRLPTLTVITGLLAAAVIASVADTVVALLARAAGASDQFTPLHPTSYVPLTVVGTLIGAAGWAVVRRVIRKPAELLRWLVPAVVAVSFVPDLALLGSSTPGSGLVAVAALMAMHLVVASVAVLAYRRVLPLSTS